MQKNCGKVICCGCAAGVLAASAGILCGAVASMKAIVPLDENDFLKTDGRKIVNAKGETVLLRGVNLDSRLLQESRMSPGSGEDNACSCRNTLEILAGRFGTDQARELINTFSDNWITFSDIEYLKKLGVNCVRFPFRYRDFQSDDKGTWIRNKDGGIDFSRLDRIVNECGKRGIYVILDLHSASGFQNNSHSCGKVRSSELFDCSIAGLKHRCRTAELWKEIAKHFKGNSAVAAFDLLNEPMSGFAENEKNEEQLWRFYNKLYSAVRTEDPDRMITVEGVWDMRNLPDPKKFCWDNIVCQLHIYNCTTQEIDNKIAEITDCTNWNVPVIAGEFLTGDMRDYAIGAFNKNSISWFTGCYKGFDTSDGRFLFTGGIDEADLQEDSFDQIKAKWGKPCRTPENFTENTDLAKKMKKYLAGYAETNLPEKALSLPQSNTQENSNSAAAQTTADYPQINSGNKPEHITAVFGTAMLFGVGTLAELEKRNEETVD